MRLFALAIMVASPASVLSQVVPGLPPAPVMIVSLLGKAVARCEVALPEFKGETEHFVKGAIEVLSGLIPAELQAQIASRLVREAEGTSTSKPTLESCKILQNQTAELLAGELPCWVREDQKLREFHAEFLRLSSGFIDSGSPQPCTGLAISEPKSKSACEREREPLVVDLIEPNSPAEQSGILVGDKVRRVNGNPVSLWRDLELTELRTGLGSSVVLEVEREGQAVEVRVPIGKRVIRPNESIACRP